jgi:hypothetical protein
MIVLQKKTSGATGSFGNISASDPLKEGQSYPHHLCRIKYLFYKEGQLHYV